LERTLPFRYSDRKRFSFLRVKEYRVQSLCTDQEPCSSRRQETREIRCAIISEVTTSSAVRCSITKMARQLLCRWITAGHRLRGRERQTSRTTGLQHDDLCHGSTQKRLGRLTPGVGRRIATQEEHAAQSKAVERR